MPSRMYLSPTGVRTTCPPAASTAAWRPPFDSTDTTRPPFGSTPRASLSSARMPRTWSPSTTAPVESAAMSRSASPSSANPTSAARAATASASAPGCVAPDATLILTPSGSLWITSTDAPVADRISGPTIPPEPFAQSRMTRVPEDSMPRASPNRWRRYASSRCPASNDRPSSSLPTPPSSSARQMSCSSSSSTASSSFRPRSSSTFRPLSSAGLWDAETMIPAANSPEPAR